MASLRRRRPLGALFAGGLALVIACDRSDEDDTQFREDVIWCEEAVARLIECCGAAFAPEAVECRHYYSKDTGCGQTSIDRVDPAFMIGESRCIQDTSCDRIVADGICRRAQAAGKARVTSYRSSEVDEPSGTTTFSSTTSTTSGSSTTGPVCP